MAELNLVHSLAQSPQIENGGASRRKTIVISSNEIIEWIKSGRILLHLFRYKRTILHAYNIELVSKLIIYAMVIRLLSRGESILKDQKGTVQKIDFQFLYFQFKQIIMDLFRRKKLIHQSTLEVDRLLSLLPSKRDEKWDLSSFPVYLRTDFCFGLQSGGSVGHIAGVLNQFEKITSSPIFISTDRIPTVNPHLECHFVYPTKEFRFFREASLLFFNKTFSKKTVEILGERKPAFFYQRYSLNNFSGVKISSQYGIPLVLEYNGSEVWVTKNWGNREIKNRALSEKIELLNLRFSHLVVVVSQPLKDELILRGIEEDRILVNPNGVDPEKYSPHIDGSIVRSRYHYEKKLVVGFIGTFGKWHGAEVLAESIGNLFERYPHFKERVRLMLIGDGVMLPEVKRILQKWNALDASLFTGTVPQELGPQFMAAADILVAPHVPNRDGTPFFGSPTKLFEYMAMGKAIVASNLNQIGEILTHNETGWLVEPGSPPSLMEGLKTMIEDPHLRSRLGDAARKRAVSNHTWEIHTRKIIDKIQEIQKQGES